MHYYEITCKYSCTSMNWSTIKFILISTFSDRYPILFQYSFKENSTDPSPFNINLISWARFLRSMSLGKHSTHRILLGIIEFPLLDPKDNFSIHFVFKKQIAPQAWNLISWYFKSIAHVSFIGILSVVIVLGMKDGDSGAETKMFLAQNNILKGQIIIFWNICLMCITEQKSRF